MKIGKYQNQIPELSSLNIKDYERIFKVYEIEENDNKIYFYNILKKIDLMDVDDEYVDFFEVKNRIPMTTLSYNIYGDIKSWWILYLMNKDQFDGPPFWVDGGKSIKYLKNEYRVLLYDDITNSTIFGGRHF